MGDNSKTILLLSPQPFDWPVSKRHYALAFCESGNVVYFLEPPSVGLVFSCKLQPSREVKNLYIVRVTLPLPKRLRFLLKRRYLGWLYDAVLSRFIRLIVRELPRIDVCLSFDNNLFFHDLSQFGSSTVGLMIMDRPNSRAASEIEARASSWNAIGAIAPDFLRSLSNVHIEKFLIHHGLSASFENVARRKLTDIVAFKPSTNSIRVGLVGNLTHPATDFENIIRVISTSPNVIFEFWGPDGQEQVLGEARITQYLDFLENADNVIRHGKVLPEVIAESVERIDIWLACYDYQKDLNAGPDGVPNSHKIMEYFATGKIIVSNFFTMYQEVKDLMAMMPSPSNKGFPEHFLSVVDNLERYNSWELQSKRIEFALSNTYRRNAAEILERLVLPR